MLSKTQTPLCMVMDVTKTTHKENGNLQANIKTLSQNSQIEQKRIKRLKEELEHFRNENENCKLEHTQLAEFEEGARKNLMIETNFWMLATTTTDNYLTRQIGIVSNSFKHEIEYVNAKLDTERTDIKIMKDRNQKKIDSMSATIIRLSQDINDVLKTLESTENKLQRQQIHQSKSPPKNNVRQPNILPPDIMDIDAVTSILKTALSATASKTSSKTVYSNAITDVKTIEYRLHSRTKTAKKNKLKLENSDNNKFGDCPL